MFEIYLFDSKKLIDCIEEDCDEEKALMYYRSAIFHAIAAMEAFLNYIAESFSESGKSPDFEVAFLLDKKFCIVDSKFQISNKSEYHKIEDKIKYLIDNNNSRVTLGSEKCWSQYLELKKFRDQLTHPRSEEDEITLAVYQKKFERGFNATIELMNLISKAVFNKNLRKKLLDLIN